VRIGGGLAGFRLGTGTEAGLAERQLARCGIAAERLGIGVGGDEFNAADAFANHVLDGIATGTTYAEYLDDGTAFFVFLDNFKHDYLL
jgi:ABC-type nitrate/sulfonate/bicarbonate transport system substrate-binding protein